MNIIKKLARKLSILKTSILKLQVPFMNGLLLLAADDFVQKLQYIMPSGSSQRSQLAKIVEESFSSQVVKQQKLQKWSSRGISKP